MLGAEKQRYQHGLSSMFLDPGLSKKRVLELSTQWNFDLPLDNKTETLTVSQRQKAAVLALLLRDVKWFIFDEPTAVLTPGETKSLFELFKKLRAEGRGIILITHKIDEALSIANRLTVMRHGVTQETDVNTFTQNCITPEHVEPRASDPAACGAEKTGNEQPVLEIKDLTLEPPGLPHIRNVNLRLMPGKILGIAGVRDGGLETLEMAVTGFLEYADKGSLTLNGHDISGMGVKAFRAAGGAYLGADRLGSNLAVELPLYESLVIHVFKRARRLFGIFLDTAYLNSWCKKIMNRAGIDRYVSDMPASLSGGMLQRVLLAREFAEEASFLVLAEAGSGLDESNRGAIADELNAHADRGAAVLLFSTDMDELQSLADELMVLKNGTLIAADEAGGTQ
jgi:simple sugar transport system ATP-binding protein